MDSVTKLDFDSRIKALDHYQGFNSERCARCGRLILGAGIIVWLQPRSDAKNQKTLRKSYVDLECALSSSVRQIQASALLLKGKISRAAQSEKKRSRKQLPKSNRKPNRKKTPSIAASITGKKK